MKGPEPTHVMALARPVPQRVHPITGEQLFSSVQLVRSACLASSTMQKKNILMSTILRISWCCSVFMQSTYLVIFLFVIPYFDFFWSPDIANTLTELPFSENVRRQLPAAVSVRASPPTGRCSGL